MNLLQTIKMAEDQTSTLKQMIKKNNQQITDGVQSLQAALEDTIDPNDQLSVDVARAMSTLLDFALDPNISIDHLSSARLFLLGTMTGGLRKDPVFERVHLECLDRFQSLLQDQLAVTIFPILEMLNQILQDESLLEKGLVIAPFMTIIMDFCHQRLEEIRPCEDQLSKLSPGLRQQVLAD